ncbi:unnamed protein product [Psylliodes chrysocephalus]|uniref:Odorant receptor n=1 Tax=Psylliodes chrysocephalus TaxID=3402493 RepID=A0A9P0GLV1_9CUCU|nr:unnamed protein product [Psylliodes chrysocephala]
MIVIWYFSQPLKELLDDIMTKFWPYDLIEGTTSEKLKKFYFTMMVIMVPLLSIGILWVTGFLLPPLFMEGRILPYPVQCNFKIMTVWYFSQTLKDFLDDIMTKFWPYDLVEGTTSERLKKFYFTIMAILVPLIALEFGISVLHARIRLFECILHLADKLKVKIYRGRKSKEEKDLEDQTKIEIQTRFRTETGLLIDMPKSNFGNTNDGNTSRRFFENPTLAAEITDISYELIYRLKVILEAISSGFEIDPVNYETARLYVKLYDWHPMTPTMHRILVHDAVIIEKALLPIGQIFEEEDVACNKHFRSYRQDFARKFSRESFNQDIFNRLLLSPDPFPRKPQPSTSPSIITLSSIFIPHKVVALKPVNIHEKLVIPRLKQYTSVEVLTSNEVLKRLREAEQKKKTNTKKNIKNKETNQKTRKQQEELT